MLFCSYWHSALKVFCIGNALCCQSCVCDSRHISAFKQVVDFYWFRRNIGTQTFCKLPYELTCLLLCAFLVAGVDQRHVQSMR